MMSRKLSPSLTSSSDFALVMPMLVPRPPFSLSTTTRSSVESLAGSGSSAASGRSSSGSISASGSVPVSPSRSLLLVEGEGVDRLVREALGAHLVGRGAHRAGCIRSARARPASSRRRTRPALGRTPTHSSARTGLLGSLGPLGRREARGVDTRQRSAAATSTHRGADPLPRSRVLPTAAVRALAPGPCRSNRTRRAGAAAPSA